MERKVVTLLSGDDPNRMHDTLSQAGFRRSQDLAYRPACDDCSACVPVRVLVREFEATRGQLRTIRRNASVTGRIMPAHATREHYAVFRHYVLARHLDGGMAEMDFADYRAMIEDSPVHTEMIEFRESRGRLFGACLTDRMADGISLVYSFFDPELADRSPGHFIILWNIGRARRLGFPHVYLGYWIPESRKMAYKVQYGPIEALGANGWRRVSPAEAESTMQCAAAAQIVSRFSALAQSGKV
jgi:arginine-tRNA-protein transferase